MLFGSGGASTTTANFNLVRFDAYHPVPTLTTLSPSGAAVGGPGFPLTVNGSNFVNGAVRSLERIGSRHEFHQPHAAAGNDTSE